jgi:ACS family sodium-dependent inorganic phosphate cotransporter
VRGLPPTRNLRHPTTERDPSPHHAPRSPHQDLSPKYASALLGITNTAGALPGVLGVTSAGYLLDATGSWALALFFPTAACQLFGAVFYSIFASSERQPWS